MNNQNNLFKLLYLLTIGFSILSTKNYAELILLQFCFFNFARIASIPVIWDYNWLIVSWATIAFGLVEETYERGDGIAKHVDPNFKYPFAHDMLTEIG
jgi:hypothetical protein